MRCSSLLITMFAAACLLAGATQGQHVASRPASGGPAGALDGAVFRDLGHGLPGQSGFTPLLIGEGSLLPGSVATLTVSKMAKSSLCHLVVGRATGLTPFKGGTLVPVPQFVVHGIPTRKGLLIWELPWPQQAATGMQFVFQVWVVDGIAVQGWAASNGLLAITA